MSTRGFEHVTPTDIARMQAKAAKPSKYRNVKVTVDGITFDSKKEAQRYHELKLMEKAGLIANLELQPRFELRVGTFIVGEYRGDFRYLESALTENGPRLCQIVVEDVKGMKTPVYQLKKKLLRAIYGIVIREI